MLIEKYKKLVVN